MKEEKEICAVCNRVIKGKRLFLSKRDKQTLGIASICICESCFYRLPYDLQPEVIKASQNQTDLEIGPLLVSALSSIYGKADLNRGWVVLMKGREGKFVKTKIGQLIDLIWVETNSINQNSCQVFSNGRKVDGAWIEKKIKDRHKKMGLVSSKRDLISS
jgi:hypothetical protein